MADQYFADALRQRMGGNTGVNGTPSTQNVTSVLTPTGTGTSTTEELVQDEYYETWDRYVADEGTKVLNGHWGLPGTPIAGRWVLDDINGSAPDPTNPNHFKRFVDRNGIGSRLVELIRGRIVDVATEVLARRGIPLRRRLQRQ